MCLVHVMPSVMLPMHAFAALRCMQNGTPPTQSSPQCVAIQRTNECTNQPTMQEDNDSAGRAPPFVDRCMCNPMLTIKHALLPVQEDAILLDAHRRLGNRWTEISKIFGDR